MTSFETVRFDVAEGVAGLTLDRPERHLTIAAGEHTGEAFRAFVATREHRST